MGRPSKQPQIKLDHVDYPQLTYEQLALKNKCSIRTVYRALDVKSPKNNNVNTTKSNVKKKSIPPQNTTQEYQFIDDPDELLISVAIRELNKPNPDSRWANILISCKKEKITTKSDVIDQFKNLPTKALVSLLNKSSQEEY